ncbi:MAG: rfaE bifunctional protein kinase chain/domain [Planctomycetota bacterium]|jgi:rfaE bifunctional protein kinase chain/domain
MPFLTLSDQVPDFSGLRVAVVGDMIVDRYLFGRPSRLSREAPVMILQHVGEEFGAGGAANVARNVWALGARARVLGAVGQDDSGVQLCRVLEKDELRCDELLKIEGWTTPTKTRVMGAEPRRTLQQILRIDREPENGLDEEAIRAICDRVSCLSEDIDALIVSDYGYGVVSEELGKAARAACEAGVVVVLDPRASLTKFKGITAATPNIAELARATGHLVDDFNDHEVLSKAARTVIDKCEMKWLLVTMGNAGMSLFSRELPDLGVFVEASGAEEVIDVSGAGDTAAAAFALSLAAGVSGPEAMRIANAASGIVVMESGAAACGDSRLRAALPSSPMPVECS